jgi:adenylate cyclase
VSGSLEIERAWLLHGAPTLPAGHRCIRIEQGYTLGPDGVRHGARLRRAVRDDGSVHLTLTRKSGAGLVRHEDERALSQAEFDGLWPGTEGRRLAKVRHVVAEGSLLWEVDRFVGIDLWLAEVELPAVDALVDLPAWLAPWVAREVTDDPRYRNSALALRGVPQAP